MREEEILKEIDIIKTTVERILEIDTNELIDISDLEQTVLASQ